MTPKPDWPPREVQLELKLPPRPGILRVCPCCGVIHASMTEQRACQQQAWREQA